MITPADDMRRSNPLEEPSVYYNEPQVNFGQSNHIFAKFVQNVKVWTTHGAAKYAPWSWLITYQ